jgi:death on curing protein
LDTGGGSGLREVDGIEAAIALPQTSFLGEEQYPTIIEKAAILAFILITRHPFIDGNKRVGHAAMVCFLYMNGLIIDADDDAQELIIIQVASGELDKEQFTDWLRKNTISTETQI